MKKKSKAGSNNYFNDNVEQAVRDYLATDCEIQRDNIYREILSPVFSRMALGIMTRYKLFPKKVTQEIFMKEAVSHLVEQMRGFDINSGKKAYSYFGTIIRNHMLLMCKKEDKTRRTDANYDDFAYEVMNDERYTYCIDENEEERLEAVDFFQRNKILEFAEFLIAENEFRFHLQDLTQKETDTLLPALIFVLTNYDTFKWGTNSREQKRNMISAIEEKSQINSNDIKKTLKKIIDRYYHYLNEYK